MRCEKTGLNKLAYETDRQTDRQRERQKEGGSCRRICKSGTLTPRENVVSEVHREKKENRVDLKQVGISITGRHSYIIRKVRTSTEARKRMTIWRRKEEDKGKEREKKDNEQTQKVRNKEKTRINRLTKKEMIDRFGYKEQTDKERKERRNRQIKKE